MINLTDIQLLIGLLLMLIGLMVGCLVLVPSTVKTGTSVRLMNTLAFIVYVSGAFLIVAVLNA